jgi:hypothetical protein
MAFREKLAWAAFLTTVLIWGGYFAVVIARVASGGGHDPLLLILFVAATVAQAVLMTAVAVIATTLSPGDARAARDERDRAVDLRAGGIAYVVVLLAVVGVIAWLHVGLHGTGTIFALIAVCILGEAVRFGAKAIGYRRASHG